MKEQLVATKIKSIVLKLYNKTAITQLCISKVKFEHNNKQNTHEFFVVPGNGIALLVMPDLETLYVFNNKLQYNKNANTK